MNGLAEAKEMVAIKLFDKQEFYTELLKLLSIIRNILN